MKRLVFLALLFSLALSLPAQQQSLAAPPPANREAQLTALRNKITKQWKTAGNAKLRAIISFKIGDSNPKDVEVYNSSKDTKFDAAARAAVLPLIPLNIEGFKAKQELRARFDPYIHAVDVYQAEDVDFGPYMAAMQKAVKKQWFPPAGSASKRTVAFWKVMNDGTIKNVRVDKTSGDPKVDAAALKAISSVGKFRPLPAGAPDSVDIQFTFDYNVKNDGKGGNHGKPGSSTGGGSSSTASKTDGEPVRLFFKHIDQFLKP